ncbi:MAG: hypothetical protein DSZ27_07140 [Thiomicrospira sp.]|nr:MAG: hypothetical protein DSZ27_07140 [Thiomicrospira sp.]
MINIKAGQCVIWKTFSSKKEKIGKIVYVKNDNRTPHQVYIDEFQNTHKKRFVTQNWGMKSSFTGILVEVETNSKKKDLYLLRRKSIISIEGIILLPNK